MKNQIKISVIIPTFNRPEQLATCLLSLNKQDIPKTLFEVIVVDDGSQPKLDLKSYLSDLEYDLKIIFQKNKGPAAARNLAVENAA